MEQGGPQEPERNPKKVAKQGRKLPSQASSDSNSPDIPNSSEKLKKSDPDFYSKIGRKGGQRTKELRGNDHYKSLAKRGGRANADKQGNPYFSKIGQKGGEMTRGRYGTKHFKEIGSKGGKKPRKKRKQTPPSDET